MDDRQVLAPFLRRLEKHCPLSDADRAALLRLPHNVKTLDSGTYLVREGDEPDRCCILLSGFAYRHKLVGDGGRQIIALHMRGDPLDLQNIFLDVSDHNIQTLTRSDVAIIPREAITMLAAEWPSLGRAMWIDTLIEASIHREWIANVGRRDARTRIAHVLCELAVRQRAAGLADGDHYELPFTQEQLADATGLTPVHVNRVLKGMGADGMIARRSRAFTVSNWDKLVRAGDFSTRYLHPGQNEIA